MKTQWQEFIECHFYDVCAMRVQYYDTIKLLDFFLPRPSD